MRTRIARALLSWCLVGATLAVASSAHASHSAGATYTGRVGGGGKVTLEISGGGSSLKFIATNVDGDTCTFTKTVIRDVDIVNHRFSTSSASGTFPSPGQASGTLRFSTPGIPGLTPSCDTGTHSWSATKIVPRSLIVKKAGTGKGTVSSTPSGIRCGSDCREIYNKGTRVTLKASPASNSKFSGWGGACSGQRKRCTVRLNRDKTVKAKFTAVRRLTVAVQGTGGGTVTSTPSGIACGSDCGQRYKKGTIVNLTASPADGSVFTGWSGACSGTGNCSVTMDRDRNVVATFEPPSEPSPSPSPSPSASPSPSPTPTPSPSPTPTPSPSPTGSLQGTWTGSTEQGDPVMITVDSQNRITYYKFGWDSGSCQSTIEVSNPNGLTQIDPNGFFDHSGSSPGFYSWTFSGVFSPSTMSGFIDIAGQSNCPGDVLVSWGGFKD